MTWQPIDTAPKDGSAVILYGLVGEPNFGYIAAKRERKVEHVVHQGHFSYGLWQTGTYWQWLDPTHWMPLPAAPEAV